MHARLAIVRRALSWVIGALLSVGRAKPTYLQIQVSFPKSGPAELPSLVQWVDVAAFDASDRAGPIRVPSAPVPMAFIDGGTIVLQSVSGKTVTVLVNGLAADGVTVLASFTGTSTPTAGNANSLPAPLNPHCRTPGDCTDAFCAGIETCQGDLDAGFGACVTAPPSAMRPEGQSCGSCSGYCDGGLCYLETCGCPTILLDGEDAGYELAPDRGQLCNTAFNDDSDAGACRTNCQPAHCGDGVVDPGEQCDLGANNGKGLGCNATCDLRGLVTTVAGDGGPEARVDGVGTAARFGEPYGMALDEASNQLYVADVSFSAVRAIDLDTSTVRTIAGGHSVEDGNGAASDPAAGFSNGAPTALILFEGGLLVTDFGALKSLSLPTTGDGGGTLTTFAGQVAVGEQPAYSVDAGPLPFGCAYGAPNGLVQLGSLLFTNTQYTEQLDVTDLAAGVFEAVHVPPVDQYAQQGGMTALGTVIYSANETNHVIYAYDTMNTDAGLTTLSPQWNGMPLNPQGLCADGEDSLYVCDPVQNLIFQYEVDSGVTTLLAGSEAFALTQPDGLGADAGFLAPQGCVFDQTHHVLYVSDWSGNLIRKVQ